MCGGFSYLFDSPTDLPTSSSSSSFYPPLPIDSADNDNASEIISSIRTQLTEFLLANAATAIHHHNNNNNGASSSRNSSAVREERNGYLNAQVSERATPLPLNH